MKKVYLSILFILLSPLSSASGWTEAVEVKRIVVVGTGGINVSVFPELTGCVSQSGYGANYASIYPEHKGLNSIHSNLLAAYMSGKKVSLYLANDSCKVTEMVLGGTYNY